MLEAFDNLPVTHLHISVRSSFQAVILAFVWCHYSVINIVIIAYQIKLQFLRLAAKGLQDGSYRNLLDLMFRFPVAYVYRVPVPGHWLSCDSSIQLQHIFCHAASHLWLSWQTTVLTVPCFSTFLMAFPRALCPVWLCFSSLLKLFCCRLSGEPSMWLFSWLSQGESPLHLFYCFIFTSLMTHQFLLVLLLFLYLSPLPWGKSWWWILCQASHLCCIFNSIFPFRLSIFISRSCFLSKLAIGFLIYISTMWTYNSSTYNNVVRRTWMFLKGIPNPVLLVKEKDHRVSLKNLLLLEKSYRLNRERKFGGNQKVTWLISDGIWHLSKEITQVSVAPLLVWLTIAVRRWEKAPELFRGLVYQCSNHAR